LGTQHRHAASKDIIHTGLKITPDSGRARISVQKKANI
jgi:hypothetical protein